MRMTGAGIEALSKLPADGSWLTVRSRKGVLRPDGVGLAAWDRAMMGRVPDEFWKPEFDEGDGRGGRDWAVFDDVSHEPDGTKSRRYRLTPAGIALLAHAAAGGKMPRG